MPHAEKRDGKLTGLAPREPSVPIAVTAAGTRLLVHGPGVPRGVQQLRQLGDIDRDTRR